MGSTRGLAHRWVDVGGLRLHCVEAGTGPLVVLLHGFPEFWYAWRRQLPAFADAGYRVVAPDLPGYNTPTSHLGCATTGPGCWPRRWPT
jgi:epoxide hydrolase 4